MFTEQVSTGSLLASFIYVVVTMLIACVPALVVCLFCERFGGLRVNSDAELRGLDRALWNTPNCVDDLAPESEPA